MGGGDVPRRYLGWRIEATRPGTWKASEVEIDYHRSWWHLGQRGTQRFATDLRFTFT